jgi:hypothetical protein
MVLLQKLGKCCACALLLIAPGSFIVLPALWLVRLLAIQAARRKTDLQQAAHGIQ